MEHVADLYGQPIMWHTDVALAVYHHACPCVENVLSVVITQAMILTCFVLKQVEHVIVETRV